MNNATKAHRKVARRMKRHGAMYVRLSDSQSVGRKTQGNRHVAVVVADGAALLSRYAYTSVALCNFSHLFHYNTHTKCVCACACACNILNIFIFFSLPLSLSLSLCWRWPQRCCCHFWRVWRVASLTNVRAHRIITHSYRQHRHQQSVGMSEWMLSWPMQAEEMRLSSYSLVGCVVLVCMSVCG